MSHRPPAGSLRDTPALAHRYSQTSRWQWERGLLLIDLAAPKDPEWIVDLGCGTGELSVELARRVAPSGRVIAVDPSPARLERAGASVPAGLDNLTFVQAKAEHLALVEDGSIDLVYSNYAVHWVLDQPAMLDEVRRILRPGGRFVAEFLREQIQLFVDLVLLMPEGGTHLEENCILDEGEWRHMIAARGCEIQRFDLAGIPLCYDSLSSLFDWLEATSHGAFDANKLPPAARRDLERRYPGEINCLCKAFRMVLRRAP
jgi:SAM-dependent methyltransferase